MSPASHGPETNEEAPAVTLNPPTHGARSHPWIDLSVSFAGIQLKNPIIAASGTFGYGVEFEDVVHLDKLGGFVVKGLSREPMIGNPPPRLWETAAGMLNAIGLQNIGATAFLEEKLPKLRKIKNIVVSSPTFSATSATTMSGPSRFSTMAKASPPTN